MSKRKEGYILDGYAPKKPEEPVSVPEDPTDPVVVEEKKDKKIIAIIAAIILIVVAVVVFLLLRSCSAPEKETAAPVAPTTVTTVDFDPGYLKHSIFGTTVDYEDFTVTTAQPVDTTDPNQSFTCTNINVTVTNRGSSAQTVDWDKAWLGVTENGIQMNTSWMITSGFNDQDIAVTRLEPGASIGAAIVVAPTSADETFYALVFTPVPTADGHAQGVYWTK